MHKEHIQITITIIYSEHIVFCFQNFADVRLFLLPSNDDVAIKEKIHNVFFVILHKRYILNCYIEKGITIPGLCDNNVFSLKYEGLYEMIIFPPE